MPSLFEKKFGRFSARMKIPAGQGMWPAFWLLGNDIDAVSWPTCGEIDIMENVGNTAATDYGTLHGPNGSQEANLGGSTMLPTGALADAFHVYTVEWKAGEVDFLLDDTPYFTATAAQFQGTWVFDDHPFYIDPQPGDRRQLARQPRREHAVPGGAPRRLGARLRRGALSALLSPPGGYLAVRGATLARNFSLHGAGRKVVGSSRTRRVVPSA